MGSKRASAWALRHLAAIDENRMLMVEKGAIEPLLKLIEEDFSEDEQGDEAQTAAIGALQILAVNDECSKQIAALGGVASLVQCLQRGSDFCKASRAATESAAPPDSCALMTSSVLGHCLSAWACFGLNPLTAALSFHHAPHD